MQRTRTKKVIISNMSMVKVAIVNRSTVMTDEQVAAMVPALQRQVTEDFYPSWGANAALTFVGKNEVPDPLCWQIVVLDNSDQAGALGYHDLTASGLPLGKVFAKTDLQYGNSVSVTVSHELLEMLADPWICWTIFNQSTNYAGIIFPLEVCDACEADDIGYEIDGVLVSDFVYPTWFEAQWHGVTGVAFDKTGKLKNPFQLAAGGYIGYFDVSKGSGWQQATADLAFGSSAEDWKGLSVAGKKLPQYSASRLPVIGSRRERRARDRALWAKSTVS
jgi:hypothetical protein